MSGSRQYLLLVDGDRSVTAALAREILPWAKSHSLEILQASSAAKAFNSIGERGDDILIVIAGLGMPDLPGSDFLAKLSLDYPHIVSFLLGSAQDIAEFAKSHNANLVSLITRPWDRWNLRVELSMAYEVAENRRIGSSRVSIGRAPVASARRVPQVLLHRAD